MEQPMGTNQPQSYEDLIGTAGVDAPTLAPLFGFDSPLGMTLAQLQSIQQLLQQADMAQLENDLFTQFCALSALSDTFLQNHRLRQKVKMLPLVVPYPQYTSLQSSRLSQLLALIDSPEFKQPISEEDPLIAAVARLKKLDVRTQTFPPITISYALKARNCLYEYIQQLTKSYSLKSIKNLMPDAEIPDNATTQEIPEQMKLKITTLLVCCYLRLGVSLQQFNLFRAAHQVFQLFLKSVDYLEILLGDKFSEHFEATARNGYRQLLEDEQINMNLDKKDDNLAYSSLELIHFPQLQKTILDRKTLFGKWKIDLEDLKNYKFQDSTPDQVVEETVGIKEEEGHIQDLVEFVYAGRQISAFNCLQLAAQIYTQQAQSLEEIEIDVKDIELAVQNLSQNQKQQNQKELTLSSLQEAKLPPAIKCSPREFALSCGLARSALQQSLQWRLFSTTLPTFKRFAELVSLLGASFLAEQFAEQIAAAGGVFEINALAWQSRWARMQNQPEKRQRLLEKRLEKAKLVAIDDKSAVKYAVSAASELVFSQQSGGKNQMEDAWNELQSSKTSKSQVDTQQIEARVRFGAVKSQLEQSKGLGEAECDGLDGFVEDM